MGVQPFENLLNINGSHAAGISNMLLGLLDPMYAKKEVVQMPACQKDLH